MDTAVEPDPEPAAMTDVRRPEETLRIGLDQHLLHSFLGGAPDREATVAVVVAEHHQERPPPAHEERRVAMAQPLSGLR